MSSIPTKKSETPNTVDRNVRLGNPVGCEAANRDSEAFVVSPFVRFYDREEMERWIRRRSRIGSDLLCVAEIKKSYQKKFKVVGFCYCKIMSVPH